MSGISARLRAMADAVEAEGRERAAALRSVADQIDHGCEPWKPLDEIAKELGVAVHVLRDAGLRGELEIGKAGRRRVVRRSSVDRWIASRAVRSVPANDLRAVVQAAEERDLARVGRGGRR